MSKSEISAPSRAKRSAVSLPNPLALPVITAFLPSSLIFHPFLSSFLFVHCIVALLLCGLFELINHQSIRPQNQYTLYSP
jgi:hypothetical protein